MDQGLKEANIALLTAIALAVFGLLLREFFYPLLPEKLQESLKKVSGLFKQDPLSAPVMPPQDAPPVLDPPSNHTGAGESEPPHQVPGKPSFFTPREKWLLHSYEQHFNQIRPITQTTNSGSAPSLYSLLQN